MSLKKIIMKNIIDYIGTECAILCKTLEEAEAIDALFIKAGGRTLMREYKKNEYPGDFAFSLIDKLPNNCYCSGRYYRDRYYTIFHPNEFLIEEYSIY